MHAYVTNFDTFFARLVARLPQWLLPFMNVISFTGLPIVIIAGALLLAGYSWLQANFRVAYAALACLIALGGNTVIKHIVHRARPDTIYVENMRIHSYSFPSGHSFGSAVFYGLLAYLAFSYLPQPWNLVIGSSLVGLIFLIGLSRVYLGAHFPSDVLVGWLLGGISLLVIIQLFQP